VGEKCTLKDTRSTGFKGADDDLLLDLLILHLLPLTTIDNQLVLIILCRSRDKSASLATTMRCAAKLGQQHKAGWQMREENKQASTCLRE